MKKLNIKSKLLLMFTVATFAISSVSCEDYLTEDPADKFTDADNSDYY